MASTPQTKRTKAEEAEAAEVFALGVAVAFACTFVWGDLNWLLAIAGGLAAAAGHGWLLFCAATHGLASALAVMLWAAAAGFGAYEQSDGSIVLAAAAAAVAATVRLEVYRDAYSSEATKPGER